MRIAACGICGGRLGKGAARISVEPIENGAAAPRKFLSCETCLGLFIEPFLVMAKVAGEDEPKAEDA